MADVKLNTLPQSTSPTSTQDLLLFDESTNAGQRINYNTLADAILTKLTSKTYTVAGGTQTLISAIDALNSKTTIEAIDITIESGITSNLFVRKQSGIVTVNGFIESSSAFGRNQTVATISAGARPIAPVRSTCALATAAYEPAGSIGYVCVDSNGEIVVTAPSNNTYKRLYFSLSYMAQL